jgi:PAS domain S-box-containing protein
LNWTDEVFLIHGVEMRKTPTFEEYLKLFAPGAGKQLRKAVDHALSTGEAWDLELPVMREGGERNWIRTVGHIEVRAGERVWLYGTVQDITESKTKSLQLAASEDRLRFAFASSNDGFWEFNPQTKKYWYAPRLLELLGLEVGQLGYEEQDFFSIIHPGDVGLLRQGIEQHLNYQVELDVECRLRNRDGSYREFRARGQAERDSMGRVVRMSGSFLDITESSQAMKDLDRALEAAIEGSRSKSQFLANMSHEIRTPMGAIIGFTELVQDGCSEEQQADYLGTIRRNADYLLAILNDILDLSKIEAGKLTFEFVPTSVSSVVREVEKLLGGNARGKGVAYEAEYLTDVPPFINSDPVRLRQILMNLVSNAIKFTESGSVRIDVAYESGSQEMTFAVTDSGIGMTKGQVSKLFQPFTQADNSTTRKFGGTGLGLTICARLASGLDGRITVDSRPGDGSTFTFCFPVEVVAGQSPKMTTSGLEMDASEDPVDPLKGRRVLLVDDGRDNQRLIGLHLKRAGLIVTSAGNGQVAVDTYQERLTDDPFDLILMDMQMPVMDGYTATGELRKIGCHLPVIALTANAMSGDREKCIQAGCSDYITKPIVPVKLLDSCRAWVLKEMQR